MWICVFSTLCHFNRKLQKFHVKMTSFLFEKIWLKEKIIPLRSNKWNGCWTHIQFFTKVLMDIVAHYCISNSTSSQSFWQNVIEINHLTSAHTNSLLKKVIIKEQHRGTLSETHNNCTRVKIVSVTQFHEILVKNVEDQFEIEMILWKKN